MQIKPTLGFLCFTAWPWVGPRIASYAVLPRMASWSLEEMWATAAHHVARTSTSFRLCVITFQEPLCHLDFVFLFFPSLMFIINIWPLNCFYFYDLFLCFPASVLIFDILVWLVLDSFMESPIDNPKIHERSGSHPDATSLDSVTQYENMKLICLLTF